MPHTQLKGQNDTDQVVAVPRETTPGDFRRIVFFGWVLHRYFEKIDPNENSSLTGR